MSERFTYQEVFGRPFMTLQDVEEANIALELQNEADKRAARRKRR